MDISITSSHDLLDTVFFRQIRSYQLEQGYIVVERMGLQRRDPKAVLNGHIDAYLSMGN